MNVMHRVLILMVVAAACFLGATAFAATEAELQQRFKERYGQLQSLKEQGKLGETAGGFVEAVKAEFAGDVSGIADPENSDRRELYDLLAKQTNATPETVAKRNAVRNFQKAKSGEWLKDSSGNWRQK